MADIRDYVNVAKILNKLTDILVDTGISHKEYQRLSEIQPNINDTLIVINEWLNGNKVCFDTDECLYDILDSVDECDISSESIETTTECDDDTEQSIEEEPIVDKKPTKSFTRRMIINIAKHICNDCVGETVKDVGDVLAKDYPDYNPTRLHNIVRKKTYTKITDKFFTIIDDRIYPNADISGKIYTPTSDPLSDDISNKDKLTEMLSDIPIAVWGPLFSAISDNDGDLSKIVMGNPQLEGKHIASLCTVKCAMVACGIYHSITDVDITIMISQAVMEVGKKKTTRIVNYIQKHWKYPVKSQDIFAVINKTMHPEISDRFFK